MYIENASFFVGFGAGFLVAAIGGFIFGHINTARNTMRRPDSPMSVQTRGTPRQVMTAAARAARNCFFWTLIFIGRLR